MKLTDFMSPELVALNVEAANKEELLLKLVEILENKDVTKDKQAIYQLLLEREKLMTTGIRTGFAIPHAFTDQLDKSLILVAKVPQGVDYEALDKAPVYVIFLLLGPKASEGIHLKLLARLARLMAVSEFYDNLIKAQDAEAIIQVIGEEEEKFSFGRVKL